MVSENVYLLVWLRRDDVVVLGVFSTLEAAQAHPIFEQRRRDWQDWYQFDEPYLGRDDDTALEFKANAVWGTRPGERFLVAEIPVSGC